MYVILHYDIKIYDWQVGVGPAGVSATGHTCFIDVVLFVVLCVMFECLVLCCLCLMYVFVLRRFGFSFGLLL